ncbi:MAG: hypothetical protein M3519_02705 [Actinomycetota bacterium]|nr:hypothetical protein [Actinomycetota bacterium]
MRARARTPITWPSPAALARVWPDVRDQFLPEFTGQDEEVQSMGIALVEGTDGAPGASYRVLHPRLSLATLTGRIGGREGARTVHAVLAETTGPRLRGALDLDGLDEPVAALFTGSSPYLDWEAESHFGPDLPLRLRVGLRWMRVRLDCRAVTDQSGVDHLEVDLRVRAAGLWRPLLAPLLAASSRVVGRSLEEGTHDVAAQVSLIATHSHRSAQERLALLEEQRDEPRREREAAERVRREHRIHEEMGQLGRQLRLAQDIVEADRWWRRTRRRWEAACDETVPRWRSDPLDHLSWSGDTVGFEVQLQVHRLVRDAGVAPGFRRRERIDALVTERTALLIAPPVPVKTAPATTASPGISTPVTRAKDTITTDDDIDAWLDLRWLASPVSVIRKVMPETSEEDATGLIRQMAREARGTRRPG